MNEYKPANFYTQLITERKIILEDQIRNARTLPVNRENTVVLRYLRIILDPMSFSTLLEYDIPIDEDDDVLFDNYHLSRKEFPWFAAYSDMYTLIEKVLQNFTSEGNDDMENKIHNIFFELNQKAGPKEEASAKKHIDKKRDEALQMYRDIQQFGLVDYIKKQIANNTKEYYSLLKNIFDISKNEELKRKVNEYIESSVLILTLFSLLTKEE